MPGVVDLSGQRFDRLRVVDRAGSNARGRSTWNCVCDCGGTAVVAALGLVGGATRSCGCLRRETNAVQGHRNATHGLSGTPTYSTWRAMLARCTQPGSGAYHKYGARGITVCDRWLNDFQSFLDDMGKRPDGKSLDRINNDLGYSPENCRWATASEQNLNRRPFKRRAATQTNNFGADLETWARNRRDGR